MRLSGSARGWLGAVLALACATAHALDRAQIARLVADDSGDKIAVIDQVLASQDRSAIPALRALRDGDLYLAPDKRVLILDPGGARDALTGATVTPAPDEDDLDKITINNRVRRHLGNVLAALQLNAPERATRLAAARTLRDDADARALPLIRAAFAKERDPEIKRVLAFTLAGLTLADPDPTVRIDAVKILGAQSTDEVRGLLAARLQAGAETDPAVRAQIESAMRRIDLRLSLIGVVGYAFSGLSLGSILLLAALGLAIIFGLMGVINMAHGELLMIGAYATYVVQNLFARHLPGLFDAYLLAAVPVAFLAAALVGVLLERLVIRHLYGRPLETLLATWGISLILIQTVRVLFGAQNVQVRNPTWMSGAVTVFGDLVLPHNRIVIIAFAAAVVLAVWLILTRTRLGLLIRAVTQNRAMADCLGVPTPRLDMLAFGLGAGIAGLGGCALSQIGNVGPDLGQGYIVDSFMVVVLGGVGQLAGTVYAAVGLGEVNKFLEPYAGAVLAKIMVLVFIILFIQKRPQGLFALRGRGAEA